MQIISAVYLTSINLVKIFLLIVTAGNKKVHSALFWKRKASQLAKENRELLAQIQEIKKSREIADKVFLGSKRKLEEYEYNLEIYEEDLEFKRKSLIERENSICGCMRDLNYPVLGCLSDVDDESAQDIPLSFDEEGRNTLTQLLISNANSLSISIALDDLMVKTDTEEIECVRLILKCFLNHLKHNSLLLNPEKELERVQKVFDHFIPPDDRIQYEIEMLDDLEYFCLGQLSVPGCHFTLLKAFYDQNIFQAESILCWEKEMPPFEVIDNSENDFRYQSKVWLTTLSIDILELNCTFCDSGCDCNSTSDSEKVPEQDSKLKWASEKHVREFYSPTLDDVETTDIITEYTEELNS